MEILIILLLIILNGLFAMSEIALVSSRKSAISAEAKKGSKSAKRTLKLIEEPERFLSTVQVGITLIGILTGLYSGEALSDDLSELFCQWGMSVSFAFSLAQVVIVVAVTFISIVVGELFPKKIGMSSAERISKVVSAPMTLLSKITMPIVWLLSKSTQLLVKIFGIKEGDLKVTEEEIKSMIAEGAEDGEVQEVEQDIVGRVFSLGDRKVESIMTNRSEIVWLSREMSNKEINDIVQENLYEVYPVGEGSLDEIVGVVYLKDLFGKLDYADFNINQVLVPAQYFHEFMDVYEVLQQMKKRQVGYGLVCDEFGQFQGIVTYKDILEGLIGAIPQQEEEPDIIERSGGGWLVDGQCPFYDFLAHFELEDLASEYDFNTVGGLILEDLDHIPTSGESLLWHGFKLEVVDMDGARIDKILVTKE